MMLKAAVTCLVFQGSLCSLSPCKLRAQLRLSLCPLLFLLLRAATAKAEGTTNAVCLKTSVIAWQRLLPLAQGAWVQHGLVEREQPLGEKDMGGWTTAVYTAEQQVYRL